MKGSPHPIASHGAGNSGTPSLGASTSSGNITIRTTWAYRSAIWQVTEADGVTLILREIRVSDLGRLFARFTDGFDILVSLPKNLRTILFVSGMLEFHFWMRSPTARNRMLIRMDWTEAGDSSNLERLYHDSSGFQPCGGDLADRADVVNEGNPDDVEFRGIRVTPNILARPHDDTAEAASEEVFCKHCGQRSYPWGTSKLHLFSLFNFLSFHDRHASQSPITIRKALSPVVQETTSDFLPIIVYF